MDNRRQPRKSEQLEDIFDAVRKLTNVGHARSTHNDVRRIRTTYADVNYQGQITADDIKPLFESIGKRIARLRVEGFDFITKNADGRHILIKNNLGKPPEECNPIQDNESEIQFLRYLRGMLLIARSSIVDPFNGNENLPVEICQSVERVYTKYQDKKHGAYLLSKDAFKTHGDSPQLTQEMAAEFANILKGVFELKDDKKAGMQLTMARDLASMMERHFDTCTIASGSSSNVVTTSLTSIQQVSKDYYSEVLINAGHSGWLQSAKHMQGFSSEDSSWLSSCFNLYAGDLVRECNPIPPSARWLPLPPTYFKEEKATIFMEKGMNFIPDLTQYDEFIRSGIMIPFDVRKVPGISDDKKYAYQKELAYDIAKEILRGQVPAKIEAFKQLYNIGDDEHFTFYINYQTLLSPLLFEKGFGHTDNNARFVSMMDEVFADLNRDSRLFQELRGNHRVDLRIDHTNSAVNRNAAFTVKDDYIALRHQRLKEAKTFIAKRMDGKEALLYPLLGELKTRLDAINALERLLDKKMDFEDSYTKIPTYAKNIMMAALDHLVIGSQGVSINGCKSCRDRTEVFSAAVKVMKENPDAMKNWEVLEKGIIDSLMQGHGFRSVGFHVAIVKAGLVHKNFKEGLRKDVQKAIKDFTPFSKALKEIDVEEAAELALDASSNPTQSGAGMFPAKSSSDPIPVRGAANSVGVPNREDRADSEPAPPKRPGSTSNTGD